MYNFPYTNFHDINMDWILKKLNELEQGETGEFVQDWNIRNVKDFGAVGNGLTDDTQAFLDALADIPETGGTVYVPNGVYLISQTLILGNGTKSTASDYNNINIIGESAICFSHVSLKNGGTVLKWIGPASGAMIEVHGPINNITIKNITLDTDHIAEYGLRLYSVQFSTFEKISVAHATAAGIKLTVWPNQTTVWGTTNNIQNAFKQIECFCAFEGSAICFDISGYPDNVMNDTNLCTFDSIIMYRNPSGIGLNLGFCDSSTFRDVGVFCNGASTTGHDILLDGTEVASFPGGMLFENVAGTMETTGTIGDIMVLGYGTGDGEAMPTDPNIRGWTSQGVQFGTWGTYP